MARESLFWGKAKGKLGEVVLYRAGGEQRSRTYVKNIKNPKSAFQMAQRIKMASLVGFFNSAKTFLRSSFTNRPAKQTGFNAFVANSLPSAITAISKTSAEDGYSVPLFYAISRGTLPYPAIRNVVSVTEASESNAEFAGLAFSAAKVVEALGSVPVTNLVTLAGYFDLMLAQDPSFASLPSKFNINIICSVYDDEGFSTEIRQIQVDKSGTSVVCTGDLSAFRYGVYPFGELSYEDGDSAPNYLVIGFGNITAGDGNGAYFVGAFISYTDESGKLVTNNANMQLVTDDRNLVDQFKSGGSVYEDYLAQLGVGATDVLATR